MEAERYVVREIEGYNISPGNQGSNSRLGIEVSVLDSRENYRIVQAFRSDLVRKGVGEGPGPAPRALAYTRARARAAELAVRLNEATP
jgi:hypothetical protein